MCILWTTIPSWSILIIFQEVFKTVLFKICETTQSISTYEEMQCVLKLMFPINQAGAGSDSYVFAKKTWQQKL